MVHLSPEQCQAPRACPPPRGDQWAAWALARRFRCCSVTQRCVSSLEAGCEWPPRRICFKFTLPVIYRFQSQPQTTEEKHRTSQLSEVTKMFSQPFLICCSVCGPFKASVLCVWLWVGEGGLLSESSLLSPSGQQPTPSAVPRAACSRSGALCQGSLTGPRTNKPSCYKVQITLAVLSFLANSLLGQAHGGTVFLPVKPPHRQWLKWNFLPGLTIFHLRFSVAFAQGSTSRPVRGHSTESHPPQPQAPDSHLSRH